MPEGPRLLTDATDAFVDRASIDWMALRARARRPADRARVEDLRLLDEVRRAATPRPCADQPHPQRALGASVAVLGAVQTITALAVLALALGSGDAAATRTPQAALTLAFGVTSLLLVPTAPRDARTLFLLAAFLATASAFAHSAVEGLPASSPPLVDVVMRGLYPEAFLPWCLWQFALDFPRVQRFTAFDVLARRAASVAWLMGVILFGANFLAAWGVVDPAVIGGLERERPAGLFWRLFTIALAPSVVAITVRTRRAPASERRKVARFAMALTLGGAPFLIVSVARVAVPGIDAWLETAAPLVRVALDRVIVGALLATPILAAGAVVLDRPFESGAGALVAMRGLRARFGRRPPRGAVDSHGQLTRALERLRLARGARELRTRLAGELRAGVGAGHTHVLMRTERGDYDDPGLAASPLAAASALTAMLRETSGPLDLSPQGPMWPLLPALDREWLEQAAISLAAPIALRDGQLAAVVVLGPRRDGTGFDRAARAWVASLMPAAAAMWEAELGARTHDARDVPVRAAAQERDEAAFECQRCGIVAADSVLPCTCEAPVGLAALPCCLADKFRVVRRLGQGGMGVAYLARDTTLDRDVVLKTLPALGPGRVARLRHEARAMAALSHDGLATIYGLELWRHTPVLVVEYCPGGTLAERIARGPLPCRDAIGIAAGLASALTSMHAQGILHRDVKPANIGLTGAGAARLLDFGLAALIDVTPGDREDDRAMGSWRAAAAGTTAYLPPEAHLGAAPAPAFDLWGLSVATLEALTGVNPFVAETRAETVQRILAVDVLHVTAPLATLDPALPPIFDRALAREPARRFADAADLHDALSTVLRSP
jgi:hypothetical protein